MKLLTVSRMRTRRKCAEKERLSYVEGWSKVRDDEALHVGGLVHEGLEAWLNATIVFGDPDNWLLEALAAVAGKAYDPFAQELVNALLGGYHRRWYRTPLKVVGAEEEFLAHLVNPDTEKRSRTWLLAGKIDGRIRIGGELYILEHKTTSESIDDALAPYWRKLDMDHQVSAYFLGAEAIARNETEIPRGCLYDVIKKPGLQPLKATPPENRKYTKPKVDKKTGEVLEPARLYKGQREEDETPEDYGRRVREKLDEDLTAWFQRRAVPRTESQLREFLEDAWTLARELHESHRRGRASRNPEACHAYGTCEFWDVCAGGLRPEEHPDRFVRRERPHPELSDELVTEAEES